MCEEKKKKSQSVYSVNERIYIMQLDATVHRITSAQHIVTCRLLKHQFVTNIMCGREHNRKSSQSQKKDAGILIKRPTAM